ncbi:UNVERIFIED_CONTAM: Na+/melibiose symporter-like transporter [Acetivibrio alkalicellulosi]
MSTPNNNKNIPLRDKLGYGIGNFSTGVAIQIVGAYLVFYSTAILGLPGSLVGLAISLSIIWDALTDPLMGYLSDITISKIFGRRHLYLIIGSIGIATTNYFTWNISSSLDFRIKFLLICVYIILLKTSMTIYVTPYTALGAEMSCDYNERTSIQASKTIFFLLGLAFVSVAGMYLFFKPTDEYIKGQLNPQSYSDMGMVSSIVILLSTFFCYISTMKYIPILNKYQIQVEKKSKFSILVESFKSTLSNSAFRYVALCYMFNNVASALLSNMGLHVFTYTFFLNSQQIASIIGVQFFVCIVSQPIWSIISKKLDKKASIILGLIICIISSIIFAIIVALRDSVIGVPLYFFPYAIIIGFGTGGLFTLPLSMVADTIDLDELNSGRRSEGVYYGCLTLYYKCSQAITIFIVGLMLDLVKFDASLPVQQKTTLISLGMILAIGSMVSFILSWLSIKKYSLTKENVLSIQKQILERNTTDNLSELV